MKRKATIISIWYLYKSISNFCSLISIMELQESRANYYSKRRPFFLEWFLTLILSEESKNTITKRKYILIPYSGIVDMTPRLQSVWSVLTAYIQGNIDPWIVLKKSLICISSFIERLQIIYPKIEIYIIFKGDLREIHRCFFYKKRETEILCYILSFSPYAIWPKTERHKYPNYPYTISCSNYKKIYIRLCMRRIHREWVCYCDHTNTRNPSDFLYIFLGSLKELFFVIIWIRFDS